MVGPERFTKIFYFYNWVTHVVIGLLVIGKLVIGLLVIGKLVDGDRGCQITNHQYTNHIIETNLQFALLSGQ
jgi:hypothetical protein